MNQTARQKFRVGQRVRDAAGKRLGVVIGYGLGLWEVQVKVVPADYVAFGGWQALPGTWTLSHCDLWEGVS